MTRPTPSPDLFAVPVATPAWTAPAQVTRAPRTYPVLHLATTTPALTRTDLYAQYQTAAGAVSAMVAALGWRPGDAVPGPLVAAREGARVAWVRWGRGR